MKIQPLKHMRSFMLLFMILFVGPGLLSSAGCHRDNDNQSCDDGMILIDGACHVDPALQCNGNDSICAQGFICGDDNKCKPRVACSSHDDCGGGICSDKNACINVGECSSDQSCIPGDICNLSTRRCEPSPCPESCTRGICNVTTKQCENSDFCNEATESTLCLEGSKCINGTCISGDQFCENETCRSGGVCSKSTFQCVNALNCEGDDSACLPGFYCNQTRCETNACADDGESCLSTGGVCNKTTGICENPKTCSASSDCLKNHSCVRPKEGKPPICLPHGEECQGECQGNQVCSFDETQQVAKCQENPNGCTTTFDCLDKNICRSNQCVAPTSHCTNDSYEPNNDSANVYAIGANNQLDELVLCENDVDIFEYDLSSSKVTNGVLVVQLHIENEDTGAGEVLLTLTDPTGNSQTFSNLNDAVYSSIIQGIFNFTAAEKGGFQIKVSSNSIYPSGIRYSLSVSETFPDVLDACKTAKPIRLSGDNRGSLENASPGLRQSCHDPEGHIPKDLWTFTVTEDSRVYVSVAASSGEPFIPVVSLQRRCYDSSTEIPGSCIESMNSTDAALWSGLLSPGTYHVIVSSKEALAAGKGEYTLKVETNPVVCPPDLALCVDGDTKSRRCNNELTGYIEVDCGTTGCDSTSGYCTWERGDTCASAIPVTEAHHPDHVFDIGLLSANISPEGKCPGVRLPESGRGREGVFRVTIPPGKAAEMQLKKTSSTPPIDLVAYVLSDCSDPLNSCIIGSDSGAVETVKVGNSSRQPQDYFFVADLYSGNVTSGEMVASFSYSDYICSVGETRCDAQGDNIEQCRADETGFEILKHCPMGCDPQNNLCRPVKGNTCSDPIVLESGVPQGPFEFDDVRDVIPSPGDCGSITAAQTGGNEFIFRVDTLEAHQVIEVTVSATSTSNPMIWLANGCSRGQIGACLQGVNDSLKVGENEVIKYVAPTPGPYYFVVEDAGFSNQNLGKFSIRADLHSRACTPGVTLPSCNPEGNKILHCSDEGLLLEYECSCTPHEQSCNTRDAKSCFSAEIIDTTNGFGTIEKKVAPTDLNTLNIEPDDDTGECRFKNENSFRGADVVYQFNLAPSQVLEVDFKPINYKTEMIAYFVESCGDLSTCRGTIRNGEQKISYTATSHAPVFLVVDSKADDYDFTFKWAVSNKVCSPGQIQCSISDNHKVSFCNNDGTLWLDYRCPNNQVCTKGACEDTVTPYANTTCASAITIPDKGAFIAWEPSEASNDSDSTCAASAGTDIFYKIEADVGEIIEVEIFSIGSFRPSVYIFDDCSDLNYCLASQEVKHNSDRSVTVTYLATAKKDYYIGLDAYGTYGQSTSYAKVEVYRPECDPQSDQPRCAGDDVIYCENGRFSTYQCAPGACSAGSCTNETGDSCFDAIHIDMTAGQGTLTNQNWEGKTNFSKITFPKSTGASNGCIFRGVPTKEEVFYAVSLNEGDTFTASIPESSSLLAKLYAIDGNCASYTCIDADPLSSTYSPLKRSRKVSFVAEKTQTYYIVVDKADSSSSSSSKTFDLHWKVLRKPTTGSITSCEPYASYCDSAAGPNAIRICNPQGTAFLQGECLAGCENGHCKVDRALMREWNTCGQAHTISKSGIYTIDFNEMSHTLAGKQSCSGLTEDLRSNDAFFKVKLEPFGRLNLYVRSSHSNDQNLPYIFTDCNQTTTTCLAAGMSIKDSMTHSDSASELGYNQVISYTAGDNIETFYVALAGTSKSSNYARQFIFDILIPECHPGTHVPSCQGNEKTYCTKEGLLEKVDCSHNGGTCSHGACTIGDGDTCHSAFYVVPEPAPGKTLTGSFELASNVYNLQRGNACTSEPTVGRDQVYAIYLTANQTLEVKAQSNETPRDDISIYLSNNCNLLPTSCVAGADAIGGSNIGDETLTYQAVRDGLVYLIVDSYYPNNFGDYTITFTLK